MEDILQPGFVEGEVCAGEGEKAFDLVLGCGGGWRAFWEVEVGWEGAYGGIDFVW